MEKTTVPELIEAPTVSRFVRPGESLRMARKDCRALAAQGVRQIVFSSPEMLRLWRARIAAIA